ncbi:MAG: L-serine ammonia-lyase, iron-sulfur-dependent subunit beta, partial [Bacteroidota bacterium]
MSEHPSIFDILGPIMIGPSSSHTAGASRIGYIARQLLHDSPKKAIVTLYNSFAKTHKGHGTDKAIIGGILGFGPDDERIRDSHELARKQGLEWEFHFRGDSVKFHSNTARVKLVGEKGGMVEVVGASLGGGRIRIQEIEGFPVDFNAQTHTLVIIAEDVPGSIQHISGAIAGRGVNIANMFVSRSETKANMVIELDQAID